MDPSRRARRDFVCEAGHRFAADVWDVLDLGANPGQRDTLTSIRCPTCGVETPVTGPLLLVNALLDVPVVSVDGWVTDDEEGRARIGRLLDEPAPPVPGLLLQVSRPALPTLLGATDADDLRQRLLAAEAASTADRELSRSLDGLVVAAAALFVLTNLTPDSADGDFADAATLLASVGNDALVRYLGAQAAALAEADIDPRVGRCRCRLVERLASGHDPIAAKELLRRDLDDLVTGEIVPEYRELVVGLWEGTAESSAERRTQLGRAIHLAGVLGESVDQARWHAERALSAVGDGMFVASDAAEQAELDLRHALALLEDGDPGPAAAELRARCSADLAIVLTGRSTGDRSENIEAAIPLFEQSLEFFGEQTHPHEWAMNSTNLSIAYVDRRAGDHESNLRTAEDLCRNALRVRSPQQDPFNWAFTATNLARAMLEQARTGGVDADELMVEALDLSEQAAAAFAGVDDERAADALHNAATAAVNRIRESRARRVRVHAAAIADEPEITQILARVDLTLGTVPDRIVAIAELAVLNPAALGLKDAPSWAADLARPKPDDKEQQLIDRGTALSTRALEIRSVEPGISFGVSCRQRDDLLQLAGASVDQRISVLEDGLALLSVDDLPGEVLDLAARLGGIHSARNDWSRAADAYATAASALGRTHDELIDQSARLGELSTHYKLVELGAYAAARAGRFEDAVLLLEGGRTRGLAVDVARDSDAAARLRETTPAGAAELDRVLVLLAARGSGTATVGGTSSADLRRQLRRLLDRIRTVDEFAGFMTGVDAPGIAAAASADCPLAYLVATPAGSATLLVESGDTADTFRATALFSDVTSTELVLCVSRFDDSGQRGLLVTAGDDLDEDILRAQRLLGNAFGQGLVDTLVPRGTTAVLIVPGGILATLPLTTAEVRTGNATGPLSESLTVAVTPSATVHRIGARRTTLRAGLPQILVAAGDPGADLPWSRSEIRAIGRLYGHVQHRAEGAAASRGFLQAHAGRASHLHLSLHGFSDAGAAMESGIMMADGPVTAAELRASVELVARVVVVSACDSGRIGIGDAPNEFRGLPFALIACGAASVVASLWPVNDFATSLLMVRFHEELLRRDGATGSAPENVVPAALQAAQAWLRSATTDDVRDFRRRHDLHRNARTGAGTRSEPRQAEIETYDGSGSHRPFAAPRHWAPFVAIV